MWVVGLVPSKMGGFERTCAEFACQAHARNVEAQFVFEGPPCDALKTRLSLVGATWHVVPEVGLLRWAQAFALWRLLRRVRPHVIHLHFCEPFALFSPFARLLRIRIVATYHYSGGSVAVRGLRRWLKEIRKVAVSRSIHSITAVSRAARDKFVGDYLVRCDRVTVIYNGTQLPPRDRSRRPNEHQLDAKSAILGPKVAFIGTLRHEKGVNIAIRAVAGAVDRLQGISLSIVGIGPELANLRRLVNDLGLHDRVTFLGLIEDVTGTLVQHDIVVVPSVWKEAFGYVLIEAMAAGCATIASNVGGIPEVITDGEDGLLVPPGDASALSNAIVRVWLDSTLRDRLIDNARSRVAKHFSLDRVVAEYWEQYPFVPKQAR